MNKTRPAIYTIAASVTLVISLACNAEADPILLGGFHGANEIAQQGANASNKVSVTLTRTGPSSDITQGNFQSSPTTWGTNTLDVAPVISATHYSIVQTGTTPGNEFTLVLSVTNTGKDTIVLKQFHYWAKKDVSNEGPNSGSLTYTSGDLDDANGTSTNLSIANGINPYDYELGGFLSDTILEPGESAVLTWAHGAPQNPSGNTGLRIDNLAISGELIPPPAGTVIIVR